MQIYFKRACDTVKTRHTTQFLCGQVIKEVPITEIPTCTNAKSRRIDTRLTKLCEWHQVLDRCCLAISDYFEELVDLIEHKLSNLLYEK